MNDHKDNTPAEIHVVDEAWELTQKFDQSLREGRAGGRRARASHKVEDLGLSPAEAVAKGLADPLAAYSSLDQAVIRGRLDLRWLQGDFFDRYGYLSPLEVVAREGAMLAEGGLSGLSRAGGEEPLGSVPEKLGLVRCAYTPSPSLLAWGDGFPGSSLIPSQVEAMARFLGTGRRGVDVYVPSALPWTYADRSELPGHLRDNFGLSLSLAGLKSSGSVVMWS